MKKLLSLVLIACVSLFAVIGCGKSPTGNDDNNHNVTLNANAGTLTAHAGNNAAITDSTTAATVGGTVSSQSMTAGGKAMDLSMSKLLAAATTVNGNISGTINGDSAGTASVTGSWSYNQSTEAVHYDVVCTFSNYSENGVLFLGGQIHFVLDMATSGSVHSGTYAITGAVRFNGSFVGTNTFTYDVDFNSATTTTYTYTSTIVSNNQTITVSYSGTSN
jgi:hypothetical protein